ncbi:hypothetical protein [Kitasatospora griseola]|uniref:hypothetical protein n=1 Tax=Kitasatospora griseola TaxID=2064 RepID=UPI000697DA90|nr:hypothetical protein [Kitasatospora griseola]
MTGFRDFLMRFRPVGSPGRAASAGVPADRPAELSAELDPVLSLLERTETQARRIRDEAALEAERRRREAARAAEEIVARARTDAREVRTRSATQARALAETAAVQLLTAAERDATAVRHRSQQRMADLVDRVVADVFAPLRASESAAESASGAQGEGGGSRWAPDGSPG